MLPNAMSPRVRFLAQKGLHLLVVVLLVSALTFLMVDLLPGGAAYHMAGMDASLEDGRWRFA